MADKTIGANLTLTDEQELAGGGRTLQDGKNLLFTAALYEVLPRASRSTEEGLPLT